MKKKRKKIKRKKIFKKKRKKSKIIRKSKKRVIYRKKRYIKKKRKIKSSKFIAKYIQAYEGVKSKISFKVNLNPEKKIKGFFDFIEKKIIDFKNTIIEEKQKFRIKKLERDRQLKKAEKEREIDLLNKQIELKKKELKEEKILEKERARDLKKFLRQEQALLRQEQAEIQRKFLEEIKLEKEIDKFRIREVKELEKLERLSLQEQREDHSSLQFRIDKLKEKYRLIRDQKIRERIKALGIEILDDDDRETLLDKERKYIAARQMIENSLESFYRSASSLVFQLNKRHITRNMSIFRCIDRRFETGEIFLKWDETPDDDWLILIYIKDNSSDGKIVIEDKCNPEKNLTNEYQSNEIFKASDAMVDSLTQLLNRERTRKN
tara:strand:+ start:155 stop:1288 length:1134 start_codon:yes stop_codon:yes gene_type:complete